MDTPTLNRIMCKIDASPAAKNVAVQIAVVFCFFLLAFGLCWAFGIEGLLDPSSWANEGTPTTGAIMVALLASDVVLPVPSSMIMTTNGYLFGVVAGSLVSLSGSMLSSFLGYLTGRLNLTKGMFPTDLSPRTEAALRSWGVAIIVLTRPLPLLAETFAVVAGMQRFGVKPFFLCSLLGTLPISILYAQIGHKASLGIPLVAISFFYLIVSGLAFGFSRYLRAGLNDAL